MAQKRSHQAIDTGASTKHANLAKQADAKQTIRSDRRKRQAFHRNNTA